MTALEFNQSLITHAEFLRPFAIHLTKNHEDANDLYQETMYKALANQEKYNTGTNIRAWLYTIMRNIFINHYRRKSKQKTIFDNTAGEILLNQSKAIIANQAESNIRMKEIQQAIDGLPEIFRTPFLLYFEGYRYHEIAEALDEPLGTIKSRIHFARKLLKEQINRY